MDTLLMTQIQIRFLAAAGIAAAALLVLTGLSSATRVAAGLEGAGPTPRSATTCVAQACPSSPERVKLGFGSGGAQAQRTGSERDLSARWAKPTQSAR